VSLYLDASVLVALFTSDALTARADAWLRARQPAVIVSDFAAEEFASADDARGVFTTFDDWTARVAGRVETGPADVSTAAACLRRLDLTLRTLDALNIAIAQRIGAQRLTFDRKMAASASALGLLVHGA
jgi:predicted nucleic acid-binding protein